MSKRLEDIKNSDYSILKVDSDLKRDWDWLIEQAEREVSHSNKINKLHFFLDSNVADLAGERCGYHVIDVAIYVISEMIAQAKVLEERLEGAHRYIDTLNMIIDEQKEETELEILELQRAYNDSQKEIVTLKNRIKALVEKYERK